MPEYVKESVCCGASVTETAPNGENSTEHLCDNCHQVCEVNEVCVFCDGTGEIETPARQAYTEARGTYIEDAFMSPCICKVAKADMSEQHD